MPNQRTSSKFFLSHCPTHLQEGQCKKRKVFKGLTSIKQIISYSEQNTQGLCKVQIIFIKSAATISTPDLVITKMQSLFYVL